MATRQKTPPQSPATPTPAGQRHGGTDVETGQGTDDHAAVEQREPRAAGT